jgi:prophage DNA circulation protein
MPDYYKTASKTAGPPGAGQGASYSSAIIRNCSFASIRFPVLSCKVKGAMRNHEHIYPHSPGAAVEKLGRELYKIEIVPCFDAKLIPAAYQGLWPGGLSNLRAVFESGATNDLILPTIGKIRAMATSWEQDYTPARSLSGEAVAWSFIEDSENARLIDSTFKQTSTLASANQNFKVEGLKLDPKPSLWDQAAGAIDSVLSYKGQIQLYSSLIESKLQSAISMFAELSDQVSELSDPRNSSGLQALTELWSQTMAFYKDQRETGMVFKFKRTNRDMDIGQVAVWLYGDSEKASDLLSLNAFADPYAIPSGTNVRYYEVK